MNQNLCSEKNMNNIKFNKLSKTNFNTKISNSTLVPGSVYFVYEEGGAN